MAGYLLVTVRLHDPRFHGAPVRDWPPSPARLFQALVASVAHGRELPAPAVAALEWLEGLPPPIIAAPRAKVGARVEMYVPNNDRDAAVDDVESLRVKKAVEPRLLDHEVLLYAWPVGADAQHTEALKDAAEGLYQFGRGVDMAWATAEFVDDDALRARLSAFCGAVYRPAGATGGRQIAVPARGSLESLRARHRAARLRTGDARGMLLFANPPKPRFRQVAYEAERTSLLFDLRHRSDVNRAWRHPIREASALVERIRDATAERLLAAIPSLSGAVEAALIGRKPGAPAGVEPAARVQVIPLPSIGHEEVDHAIRRVCVIVPPGCPIAPADIAWALADLDCRDTGTGQFAGWVLVPAEDTTMLRRYEQAARRWNSVTPVAVPEVAGRRRIDPCAKRAQAKGGEERADEQTRACAAVEQAFRHAGIDVAAVRIAVQREPLQRRGSRAEVFAPGTRFAKERLWHVALELAEPLRGPLVLGDGRFLGLGLFAPDATIDDLIVFDLVSGELRDPVSGARALRRAVMARVAEVLGSRAPLPPYFSGHEPEGGPLESERDAHLGFHCDLAGRRLLVVAPRLVGQRERLGHERRHLQLLARAIESMTVLRVPGGHELTLARNVGEGRDTYLGRARTWVSVEPYTVTRHHDLGDARAAVVADVRAACAAQRLPIPDIEVIRTRGVPDHGLQAQLRLRFREAIQGPLALGRTRFLGGGLFVPERC